MTSKALVLGARGLLGRAVVERLEESGLGVRCASRSAGTDEWIVTSHADWAAAITPRSIDRVVWAQGQNAQGTILDNRPGQLNELLDANVHYVVDTLRTLLDHDRLASPA